MDIDTLPISARSLALITFNVWLPVLPLANILPRARTVSGCFPTVILIPYQPDKPFNMPSVRWVINGLGPLFHVLNVCRCLSTSRPREKIFALSYEGPAIFPVSPRFALIDATMYPREAS